jgi:FkbM family methyltransferase
MFASRLRRIAQTIRHAHGLRYLDTLWNLVRPSYKHALDVLSAGRGVEVEIAGCTIRLNPHFAGAAWESIERESYERFARTVQPGDIVYDVGASIGTYSLVALQKSAPDGRVVAYEPVELTRKFLIDHLQWNNTIDRAIVRPVCCGLESQEVPLYFREEEMIGDSGLVPFPGAQMKIVQVRSLDSEVANLGLVPTIIKIDVEGWEFDMLKGSEETLKRYGPTLFLSLHPKVLAQWKVSPETVQAWLEERGYRLELIGADHEIHLLASFVGGCGSRNSTVKVDRAFNADC